jgi:hypothetical protein
MQYMSLKRFKFGHFVWALLPLLMSVGMGQKETNVSLMQDGYTGRLCGLLC